MKKKLLLTLTMLFALTMVLAACGDDKGSSEGGKDGKIKLLVAHNQASPDNPYQVGLLEFKKVVEEEEAAKKELESTEKFCREDSDYRSFGMVKYAKIMSFEESLELLSSLKFGLELGIIDEVKKFDYYELINIISDSNIEISYIKDKKATLDEIDFIRACVAREKILIDYAYL